MQILTAPRTDGNWAVELRSKEVTTQHVVSVPAGFVPALGCGEVAVEDLLRSSFEFLLEREPATSILPRFSIDQIAQYFPEYPAEIRRRIVGTTD
ncbi:MAG: hypothetical protein ACLPQS_07075 [Acidimicrobiales bacterium]